MIQSFPCSVFLAKVGECTRATKIMDGISDTLDIMLAVGGNGHGLLTEVEQRTHDSTRLS